VAPVRHGRGFRLRRTAPARALVLRPDGASADDNRATLRYAEEHQGRTPSLKPDSGEARDNLKRPGKALGRSPNRIPHVPFRAHAGDWVASPQPAE
jgi:hypothetical protein